MPDDGNKDGQQQQDGDKQEAKPLVYSEWVKGQGADVQAMIDGEVRGLKGALEAERAQRKAHERELRDAARKLEEGSEARKSMEAQADKLRVLERQAAFYDQAHASGCSNLRLAFIAAQDVGLVRDDGSADWEILKARFPELFAIKAPPRGHAGDGNDKGTPTPTGMDAFIRSAAGLRPR